jgi:hypothetical protein
MVAWNFNEFIPDHRSIQAHQYALINPMFVDEDVWADLPVRILVPSMYANQPHLFPVLVELGKLELSTRIGLLDRMQHWWKNHEMPLFCALLASEDDAKTVCRHLVNRMALRLPAGKDDVLRFHDQRVFQHLLWIFDHQQMTHLFGNISAWSWCGSNGIWHECVNPEASPAKRLNASWQFSGQQWASLFRLGEVNQGLAILARKEPSMVENSDLAKKIDALLAESWAHYQLADSTDRWLYAEQAIRFGKGIHRHPALQQRLRDAGKDGRTYVGACADLDDNAMRQMAMELQNIREEV